MDFFAELTINSSQEAPFGCNTAQQMKYSIEDIFSKCGQIRSFLQIFTFTEEILNGKLH